MSGLLAAALTWSGAALLTTGLVRALWRPQRGPVPPASPLPPLLIGEIRDLHYLHARWTGATSRQAPWVRVYRLTVYVESEHGSPRSAPTDGRPTQLAATRRPADVCAMAFDRVVRLRRLGGGVYVGLLEVSLDDWVGDHPPVQLVAFQPATGRVVLRHCAGPSPDPAIRAAGVLDGPAPCDLSPSHPNLERLS